MKNTNLFRFLNEKNQNRFIFQVENNSSFDNYNTTGEKSTQISDSDIDEKTQDIINTMREMGVEEEEIQNLLKRLQEKDKQRDINLADNSQKVQTITRTITRTVVSSRSIYGNSDFSSYGHYDHIDAGESTKRGVIRQRDVTNLTSNEATSVHKEERLYPNEIEGLKEKIPFTENGQELLKELITDRVKNGNPDMKGLQLKLVVNNMLNLKIKQLVASEKALQSGRLSSKDYETLLIAENNTAGRNIFNINNEIKQSEIDINTIDTPAGNKTRSVVPRTVTEAEIDSRTTRSKRRGRPTVSYETNMDDLPDSQQKQIQDIMIKYGITDVTIDDVNHPYIDNFCKISYTIKGGTRSSISAEGSHEDIIQSLKASLDQESAGKVVRPRMVSYSDDEYNKIMNN